MYLTFVPYYWDDVKDEPSLEKAGTKIVMANIARVPEEHRTRRSPPPATCSSSSTPSTPRRAYVGYVLLARPRVRRLPCGRKHRPAADRERAEQRWPPRLRRVEGLQRLVLLLAAWGLPAPRPEGLHDNRLRGARLRRRAEERARPGRDRARAASARSSAGTASTTRSSSTTTGSASISCSSPRTTSTSGTAPAPTTRRTKRATTG